MVDALFIAHCAEHTQRQLSDIFTNASLQRSRSSSSLTLQSATVPSSSSSSSPPQSAEQLKKVEKKTGYRKAYFFLGGVTFIGIFIAVIGGMKLVADLIGFLYPAYMSFKSMESGNDIAQDATQWLTYWIVFSAMTVMESIAGFLIGYIPFYYVIKIGIVVWLYHPKTKGAELVYTQMLRSHVVPAMESTKDTKKAD